MNKISFVILNYNSFDMTLKLIENIERIRPDTFSTDIIVVDNNSTNESKSVLEDKSDNGKRYIFIANSSNAGYAAGNNIGIKKAIKNGANFVLVTNNDIVIENFQSIKNMYNIMMTDASVAVVSPKIMGKNGENDPPLYIECPSFIDMTFGILNSRKRRFLFQQDQNAEIYAPRGSFMLLRGETIQEIGFLDESTFLYYEEPILAEKLTRVGKKAWYCGESVVIHNHGETITSVFKKKKTCEILCNSLRYYLKEYRKMNRIQIAICVAFRKLAFFRR